MMEKYPKNSLLGQLKKSGINIESNDTGEYLPFGILTGNFDMSPFNSSNKKTDPIKKEPKIVKKRLNDLDNNFFQESSYIDIDDKELTKEEKIKKIKALIKNIDEKIYLLEDSDDKIMLDKLNSEKDILQSALSLLENNFSKENLNLSYSKNPAVRELAEKIHIKDKLEEIEAIFFKIFPSLRKSFLVRKALNKLVKLNENVNNLCSKKIPYGESEGRYNDIIAYLSCANVIHAKLTKKM